ncbi:MAG: hypothetical protein AAFR20_06430 [Pseudomonadota bacterium]
MEQTEDLFSLDDRLHALLRLADHCIAFSEHCHRIAMRLNFRESDLGFVLTHAFCRLFVITGRILDYVSEPVPYRRCAARPSRGGLAVYRPPSPTARLKDPFGILISVKGLAAKSRTMIRRDQAFRFGHESCVLRDIDPSPGPSPSPGPGPGPVSKTAVPQSNGPWPSPEGREFGSYRPALPVKQSADPASVAAIPERVHAGPGT